MEKSYDCITAMMWVVGKSDSHQCAYCGGPNCFIEKIESPRTDRVFDVEIRCRDCNELDCVFIKEPALLKIAALWAIGTSYSYIDEPTEKDKQRRLVLLNGGKT